MEQPDFEQPKEREIPEEELIDALKEKGIENPEARKMLMAWIRQQEAIVNQKEEGTERYAAQVELNIKRATIYFQAGYANEALEDLEETRAQAFYEFGPESELYKKICEKMDEIEEAYGN